MSAAPSLPVYRREHLAGDIAAGLSVAAVALPVGIAYADIVGAPPEMGLYAGIFPVLAYAVLGSSRQLIIGPDTATCLLLAASVTPLAGGDAARHVSLVSAVTLLSGALFLIAGAARLGFLANFLSRPILTGFMNGVALVVAAGQLPKIFGYPSEAQEALPRLAEFVRRVADSHPITAAVGLAAIAGLFALKRVVPRLPGPLIVSAVAVAAAVALNLGAAGVALTGPVPAGLPDVALPALPPETWRALLPDAVGVTLIAFTSGMLSAKIYARRGGYEVDADRELFAMGAANLVAGATQGFAVAGTDSRTAVNAASGARTKLAGVVAALAMLGAAFLLSDLIAQAPASAFGAVVFVAVMGLFDISGLRGFWAMSRREAAISAITTLGVLVLGVLPGVLLAVMLSLGWLLSRALTPSDAVLGRVPGVAGFHNVADFPEAETIPGLLLYRFEANIVFFNVDVFCARLETAIAAQEPPVEWVVVDLAPVSLIDATGLERFDELRLSLAARGVTLCVTHARRNLARSFEGDWARSRVGSRPTARFDTPHEAIAAFQARGTDPSGRESRGEPSERTEDEQEEQGRS